LYTSGYIDLRPILRYPKAQAQKGNCPNAESLKSIA